MKNRVRDVVKTYINVVKREASQNWYNNQYQTFDPYNITQAQAVLYPSIKYRDKIVSVYYTRFDRDLYVGYGRYCDCGDNSIHFQLGIDGKYCTQPVDDIVTGFTTPRCNDSMVYSAQERWHINQARKVGLSSAEPNYIGDKRWTAEPVVWTSTIAPVTNASNSSQVLGVAAASYTVSAITDFLKSIQLSPNSAIYIIDSVKGRMIASSQPNEEVYEMRDGKLVMFPLSKSKNPVMGYIGSQLELKYRGNYSAVKSQLFKVESNTYLVDAVVIDGDSDSIFKIALVMIAISDYMGTAKSLERALLIVDIVLLGNAILLGTIFSMLITHPLSNMTSKMQQKAFFERMGQGCGCSRHQRKKSLLYEVSTLQSNFAKMENAVNGFMKYVPREVVLNFINHPTQQKLFQPGVEPANIAIMFTDIEDFTAISEKLQPNVLIKILTEYLETVSSIINKHGGTLDKYIGDSVMALFGCPEKLNDFVMQACCSALTIRDATAVLNASNQEIGLPALNTRIGIHAGACLVGNIGSSYRLSYTSIGDTVNLASRIECLNKYYGSYLMISQECYDEVKNRILCRKLDKVAVKGRTKGEVVYELLTRIESATEQEKDFAISYDFIMSLYFDQRFDSALREVIKFQAKFPSDKAAQVMKERLIVLIQNPATAQSWDGCTVMHEK